jgi:hypothetical protein
MRNLEANYRDQSDLLLRMVQLDIIAVIILFDSRTLARLQEMCGTKKIMVDNTAHSPALLHV